MSTSKRDEYRAIYGTAFDEISGANDWSGLALEEQAGRLRKAMDAEDEKYGTKGRFEPGHDFSRVVRILSQT